MKNTQLKNNRYAGRIIAAALVACSVSITAIHANEADAGTKLVKFFPARSVDEITKEDAFQSGRMAFFRAGEKLAVLEEYDPFKAETIISNYDANLTKLQPHSSTKYDFNSYKAFEEHYSGKLKVGFDKLFRSTANVGIASPFLKLYVKSVPTYVTLRDEKDFSLLITHLRNVFGRTGLTPSIEKPLLVISIDGKTTALTGSFADADFLSKYYNVVSFADKDVYDRFLTAHKDMIEQVVEGTVSGKLKYPNDGYVGALSRDFNMSTNKMDVTANAVEISKWAVRGTVAVGFAMMVTEPIGKLLRGKTEAGVKTVGDKVGETSVGKTISKTLGIEVKQEKTPEERKAELEKREAEKAKRLQELLKLPDNELLAKILLALTKQTA